MPPVGDICCFLEKSHWTKRCFFCFLCMCTGVSYVSTRASLSWQVFITWLWLTPSRRSKTNAGFVKSTLHVIPSTHLFMFMCACSRLSLSMLVYISADLTFHLSIYLAALSTGLSDCSVTNPKVLLGSFKFFPMFIMCSKPENLLFCSQAILRQKDRVLHIGPSYRPLIFQLQLLHLNAHMRAKMLYTTCPSPPMSS